MKLLGPVGHLSTGFSAGFAASRDNLGLSAIITAAVFARQSLGYWQKADRVSKDTMEFMVGFAIGYIAGWLTRPSQTTGKQRRRLGPLDR